MLDAGEIAIGAAVEISRLEPEIQEKRVNVAFTHKTSIQTGVVRLVRLLHLKVEN
jgi:hypothetical protein